MLPPLLLQLFLVLGSLPTCSSWLLFFSYCSLLLMAMAASTHHSANSNTFAQDEEQNKSFPSLFRDVILPHQCWNSHLQLTVIWPCVSFPNWQLQCDKEDEGETARSPSSIPYSSPMSLTVAVLRWLQELREKKVLSHESSDAATLDVSFLQGFRGRGSYLPDEESEYLAPPWMCEELGAGDTCRCHLLVYPSIAI